MSLGMLKNTSSSTPWLGTWTLPLLGGLALLGASSSLLLGPLNAAPSEPFKTKAELYKSVEKKRHFSFEWDQDLNQFPDDWFVEKGPKFESYHKTLLSPQQGYNSDTALAMQFSGGRTGVVSAPLKLEQRFAYNIKLHYRSTGLHAKFNHVLSFGLRAYDIDDQLLATYTSTQTDFSKDWNISDLLRIESLPENTHSCTLFIQLAGRPSGLATLFVDELKIEASPRIVFKTGQNLNTYASDSKVQFQQIIEGTQIGKTYQYASQIRDFMGNPIGADSDKSIRGSVQAITLDKEIPNAPSGVYYVTSTLKDGDRTLVHREDIVAKNSDRPQTGSNPKFGVLLGHPQAPFEPLLESMKLLGTSISKLNLYPEDFSFSQYEPKTGLEKLNPLLKRLAPDAGYHFIAVLNRYPLNETKAKAKDPYQLPSNVVQTFPMFPKPWQSHLDNIILHYGNVFSDWQFGHDQQIVGREDLNQGSEVIEHLKQNTDWMKLYTPDRYDSQLANEEGFIKNLFIPAQTTDEDLLKALADTPLEQIDVTVQVAQNDSAQQLEIIENLVRKITYLKASQNRRGENLVRRLFIDRLSGDHYGLMNQKYQPQSSYFAVKTLIYWMHNAEYIGQFQNPDHDVVSHVFTRGDEAFTILWRQQRSNQKVQLHLGDELKLMDLMGNTKNLQNDERGGVSFELGSTPIFVVSPHPELWQTILSIQLTHSDLKAKVQFQNQGLQFKNFFPQQAKFDLNFRYPEGFQLQVSQFSVEVPSQSTQQQTLQLSPSPLFPLNKGVPLYLDLEVSYPKVHHRAIVYREDKLNSDVTLEANFFKDPEGLKLGVHLNLNPQAKKASTFIVSVLLPDGQTLETFFKRVQPGEQRQNTLFILNGEKHLGKTLVLTARESIGQRYLNAEFDIKTNY